MVKAFIDGIGTGSILLTLLAEGFFSVELIWSWWMVELVDGIGTKWKKVAVIKSEARIAVLVFGVHEAWDVSKFRNDVFHTFMDIGLTGSVFLTISTEGAFGNLGEWFHFRPWNILIDGIGTKWKHVAVIKSEAWITVPVLGVHESWSTEFLPGVPCALYDVSLTGAMFLTINAESFVCYQLDTMSSIDGGDNFVFLDSILNVSSSLKEGH